MTSSKSFAFVSHVNFCHTPNGVCSHLPPRLPLCKHRHPSVICSARSRVRQKSSTWKFSGLFYYLVINVLFSLPFFRSSFIILPDASLVVNNFFKLIISYFQTAYESVLFHVVLADSLYIISFQFWIVNSFFNFFNNLFYYSLYITFQYISAGRISLLLVFIQIISKFIAT